jgi:hypothetical protein
MKTVAAGIIAGVLCASFFVVPAGLEAKGRRGALIIVTKVDGIQVKGEPFGGPMIRARAWRVLPLLHGLVALAFSCMEPAAAAWFVPVAVADRQSLAGVTLTEIGGFGEQRKARPGVPAHLHTGVDLRRPDGEYDSQPVFPAARGVVMSVRADGPFAQVIVEHRRQAGSDADSDRGLGFTVVWTVYEHFTDIAVVPGDPVQPLQPMGRFFNRHELDRYGWQFDHLHFEVMIVAPPRVPPTAELPNRSFGTYALLCYDRGQLLRRLCDPLEFLRARFRDAQAPSPRQ